jgi:hypothetical protein
VRHSMDSRRGLSPSPIEIFYRYDSVFREPTHAVGMLQNPLHNLGLRGRDARDRVATTVPSLRDSTLFHFASGTYVPGFPMSPLRGWSK